MPLPPPLMTSSFYSRCGHIPIYRPTLLRVSSSSHPPPVLSISAPSFLRTAYEPHISAYKIAGASFCLLRDNYRRSLRRRLHPKAVIPVGVIDSRNFRTKTATRNRIDFVVRVALVLVGLDTAKFHGGYRSSNFIVK